MLYPHFLHSLGVKNVGLIYNVMYIHLRGATEI